MIAVNDQSENVGGAIQHLQAALSAEEMDEVNYHIRQTLQILGVERDA